MSAKGFICFVKDSTIPVFTEPWHLTKRKKELIIFYRHGFIFIASLLQRLYYQTY